MIPLRKNSLIFDGCIELARSIYLFLNKDIRQAKAYYREARSHEKNNHHEKAIPLLNSANKLFQENSCYIKSSQCFLDLAMHYSHYGDYHQALECNKSAKWILRRQEK